jgi:hypothetical protein
VPHQGRWVIRARPDILPNQCGVRLCLVKRHPINCWPSSPSVPDRLRSGERARCLPQTANLGDFEADDSNIERDGHVALHHQLEPQGPISPCPHPFVDSNPSKDWPKSGFPKHNVRSWLRWVLLRTISGGDWPPWSHRGIMAPTRE